MASAPTSLLAWKSSNFPLSENDAVQLHLSIRIAADGLYFLAHPPQHAATKVYSAYVPFEVPGVEGLKKAFYTEAFLAYPYASTHIYLQESNSYLLLPQDIAHVAPESNWLQVVTSHQHMHLMSAPIPDMRTQLVYGVEEEMYQFCSRSFSYPRFGHRIIPFSGYAVQLARQQHPKIMMALIEGEVMDLIFAQNGTLQMANRYNAKTATDRLYYLTSVWRLFGLNPEETPLYLFTSTPPEMDSLLATLQTQIRHLHCHHYPTTQELTPYTKGNQTLPPVLILNHLCV